MIILRNKTYSRFSDILQSGLFGSILGGFVGGAVGMLGGNIKAGVSIGAGIGALGFSGLGWELTKPLSEEQKKRAQELQENRDRLMNNPGLLYDHLYNRSSVSDYKNFEKRNNIELPKDFYKILSIQKNFKNEFIKYYNDCKKYSEENSGIVFSPISAIYPPCSVREMEYWLKAEKNIGLFMNPGQADDSFIVWLLNSNSFNAGSLDEKTSEKSLIKVYRDLLILNTSFLKDGNYINEKETLTLINKFLGKL